jgi:hypothetical protein
VRSTRSPFTRVPFLLCRSSTVASVPPTTTRAWRRETVAESTRGVAVGVAPQQVRAARERPLATALHETGAPRRARRRGGGGARVAPKRVPVAGDRPDEPRRPRHVAQGGTTA